MAEQESMALVRASESRRRRGSADSGALEEYTERINSGTDGETPSFEGIFSTPASRLAWQQHVATLTQEEKKLFMQYTATYVSGDVETLTKDLQASAKTQQQSSRLVKVNAFLRPIFRTVNLYMPPLATGLQADPYPASAIIGGIMCIVHVSNNLDEYFDLITLWLEKMTFKTTILADFEVEIYGTDERVQGVLVNLYADVLDFCQKAFRLVKEKGSGRIFRKSLKEKFQDTFGPVIKQFEMHLDQYADVAKLCESRRLVQFYKFQATEANRQEAFRKQQTTMMNDFYASQQLVYRSHPFSAVPEDRVIEYGGKGLRTVADQSFGQEVDNKRSACINWLQSVEHSDEQSRRMRICADKTCLWLQGHENYKAWSSSKNSSLLWVKGKAGSGKSILAAKTLDVLQSQNPQCRVAYFYCSAADVSSSDCSILLSTLLKQLICSTPELDEHLERLYDRKSLIERKGPSDDEVLGVLQSVLSKYNDTYILIDGLDECAEAKVALKYIKVLLSSSISILRILIFSRPDHKEISAPLASYPQLQLDHGFNSTDIKTFVSSRLMEDEFPWNTNSELVTTVTTKLVDAAQNVFLYSELQLRRLEGPLNENEILRRLGENPRGLKELYLKALERIAELPDKYVRQMAQRAIIWVANVRRPMLKLELQEALSIASQNISSAGTGQINFSGICADMIYLDETDHYQLVHASLKDYLCSLTTMDAEKLQEFVDYQKNADKIISNACLEYMLSEQFEYRVCSTFLESQELLENHPFLSYSAEHWASHVRASKEPVDETHAAWKLLDRVELRNLVLQVSLRDATDKEVFPFPHGTQLLHFLAFFGLDEFAALRPDMSQQIPLFDGLGLLPLDYALRNECESMANWIISNHDGSKLSLEDGHYYALHTAIQNHWNDIVELLINKGANLEERNNSYNSTPLCYAALFDNSFAAGKLLAANVDVNAPERRGWTPLLLAVDAGYIQVVRQLVKHEHIKVEAAQFLGLTPLHIACIGGSLSMVKLVINDDIVNAEAVNAHGRRPIHEAATNNHPDIVRELCRRGADLEAEDEEGYRALQYAVRSNALGAVKALADLGTSFEQETSDVEPILHLAIMTGSLPMVEFVIGEYPGAIARRDTSGRTPIHIAAGSGQTQVIKLLLEKGARVETLNNFNETPLHQAFYSRSSDTVTLLLDIGADATKVNRAKRTCFHLAAYANMPDVVERLLDLDIAHDTLDDFSGLPLTIAAASGEDLFALRLIEQVTARGMDLGIKKDLKTSPLHIACLGGLTTLVKALLPHSDIDCRSALNETPLWFAVLYGHIDTVLLLLEHGCDLEVSDDDEGYTPLLLATQKRFTEIQKALLAKGASTTATGLGDRTLLHIAAGVGDLDLIKILLDQGHDVHHQDVEGQSPFMYAVMSGDIATVDYLLSLGVVAERHGDQYGSCLAKARACNDRKMIQKMLDLGFDANESDNLFDSDEDESVLGKAIYSGQTTIVQTLITHGAKIPTNIEQLFISVVESGYVEMVESLLKHGWDLIHPKQGTIMPLNAAVRAGRPAMVQLLLESGADPYAVDYLNYHSFDYAKSRSEILQLLYNALKQAGAEYEHATHKRFDDPKVLGWAVEELFIDLEFRSHGRSWSSRSHLRELWFLASDLNLDEAFEAIGYIYYSQCGVCCDICFTELSVKKTFYVCKSDKACLCESCHNAYKTCRNNNACLPHGFLVYQHLESKLESVANILLPAFQKEGIHVANFCLGSLDFLRQWLFDQLEDYEDWEMRFGESYINIPKPGLEFLQLVMKISNWFSDHGRSSKRPDVTQKAQLQKLEAELRQHCEKYGFKRSMQIISCSEHRLVKMDIDSFAKTPEQDKKLDPHYFKNDFQRAMRERMQNPKPHADATYIDNVDTNDVRNPVNLMKRLSPLNEKGRSVLIGLRLMQLLDPQYFATYMDRRHRLNTWRFLYLELHDEPLKNTGTSS